MYSDARSGADTRGERAATSISCRFSVGAANRVDAFRFALSVGLQLGSAGKRMDHAAAHRKLVGREVVRDPRRLESPQTARRERKIDGASRIVRRRSRIGTPLVELDIEPAPRQQDREQGAAQSGTDDVTSDAGSAIADAHVRCGTHHAGSIDSNARRGIHGQRSSDSLRTRAKANTSSKRV